MWAKNEQTNSHGTKSCEQHSSGGKVFGAADFLVVFGGDTVGEEFDRGVKCLGCVYLNDRDDEPGPIGVANSQKKAGSDDKQRRKQVNPGVSLGAQKIGETGEGEAKAVKKLSHRSEQKRAG